VGLGLIAAGWGAQALAEPVLDADFQYALRLPCPSGDQSRLSPLGLGDSKGAPLTTQEVTLLIGGQAGSAKVRRAASWPSESSQCLATRHSRKQERPEAAEHRASVKDFVVALSFWSGTGPRQVSGSDLLAFGAGYGWSALSWLIKESPARPPPRRPRNGRGLDGHNHSPGKPRQPLGGFSVSSHGLMFKRGTDTLLPPLASMRHPPRSSISLFR